jgi:hypothetical protein
VVGPESMTHTLTHTLTRSMPAPRLLGCLALPLTLTHSPTCRYSWQAMENFSAALCHDVPGMVWPHGPPSGTTLRLPRLRKHTCSRSLIVVVALTRHNRHDEHLHLSSLPRHSRGKVTRQITYLRGLGCPRTPGVVGPCFIDAQPVVGARCLGPGVGTRMRDQRGRASQGGNFRRGWWPQGAVQDSHWMEAGIIWGPARSRVGASAQASPT